MKSGIRFCPFCKEPFEGEMCPDHGLPLVDGVELASVRRIPHESEQLSAADFRFGRLTLILGALLVLFGLSQMVVVDHSRGTVTTGFALWQLRADYLGVVPAAAVVIVALAFIRRTRRDIARARAAMAVALFAALGASMLAASRVLEYSRHLDKLGAENGLAPGIGVAIVALGFAVLGYGIATAGRASKAPRR